MKKEKKKIKTKKKNNNKNKNERKSWESVYSSFINGKWLSPLGIILALLPLFIKVYDIVLDYSSHNESALIIKGDGIITGLDRNVQIMPSNKGFTIASLSIHWLVEDEIHSKRVSNKFDLGILIRQMEKPFSQITQQLDFMSKANELLWCPIVLDVEFQDDIKSKTIHRKYIYRVNRHLDYIYADHKNDISFGPMTRFNYICKYGVYSIEYEKSLRLWRNEKKVLRRLYNKSKNEFVKSAVPIKEIKKKLNL